MGDDCLSVDNLGHLRYLRQVSRMIDVGRFLGNQINAGGGGGGQVDSYVPKMHFTHMQTRYGDSESLLSKYMQTRSSLWLVLNIYSSWTKRKLNLVLLN